MPLHVLTIPILSQVKLDIEITEGTVDGDLFVHSVEHTLLPILQPFNGKNPRSIVVLDNASVHHMSRVAELIHSVGLSTSLQSRFSAIRRRNIS